VGSTEFFQYINRASAAQEAQQVAALHAEVLLRWPGDPFAEELALALYSHEVLLEATRGIWQAVADAVNGRQAARVPHRSRDRVARPSRRDAA